RCGLDRDEGWQWLPEKNQWFGRKPSCAQLRPDGLAIDEQLPLNLGIAHELFEALFGSIKDDIKGKHLLIVPSGPLTQVPFHVLITEQPDPAATSAEKFRRVAWLAKSNAITVLPSVSSLRALREQAKTSHATNSFVGFGNPLLEGNPEESWQVERARKAR